MMSAPTPLPPTVRVLIVDDHPWVRLGISGLLAVAVGFVVCGEAETAEDALELAERIQPDIVIVDISLRGGMDGIALTGMLKNRLPSPAVLVLSMHAEPHFASLALSAGADGYLNKSEVFGIAEVLRLIMRGETYVSPGMTDALASDPG